MAYFAGPLAIVIVAGLVPLQASPAAAAGPPRKASIDLYYAVKIGVAAVQANGTGQVNAFASCCLVGFAARAGRRTARQRRR